MGTQTAMRSALLFAVLACTGVVAIESGWLNTGGGQAWHTPDFSSGYVPGQHSSIPLEIRLRMKQGWIAGVAAVTGSRHLRIGDEEFALAFIEPRGGAATALERLAGGRWVACTHVRGAQPAGGHCVRDDGVDLGVALIETGSAGASASAPMGFKIAADRWAR